MSFSEAVEVKEEFLDTHTILQHLSLQSVLHIEVLVDLWSGLSIQLNKRPFRHVIPCHPKGTH